MSSLPKLAFVYDWFDTPVGGAERVLHTLHTAFPDAPWYTSHIDKDVAAWAKGWDIRTSFIQKLPRWFRRNRILCLPFLPFAFESFNLSEYDVVVSITSAFAKGIVTRTQTRHICYLLTPPRWMYQHKSQNTKHNTIWWIEKSAREYLQRWDYISAQRVDEFFSISQEVAKRCKEYYERESEVLYPPFDTKYWQDMLANSERRIAKGKKRVQDINDTHFFLIVSRLEPYKKVGLSIEAFAEYRRMTQKGSLHPRHFGRGVGMTKKDIKLIIVETGTQKNALRATSCALHVDQDIVWLEKVTDEELAWLFAHCRAFIMPQEEDFGYVACEARACGAPVVAYAHGGQVEILQDYPNKALFEAQTVDSLVSALEKILLFKYNARTYENRNIRGGSRDSFVATLTQKITQTV